MSRLSSLFFVVLPSMLAGGLLFGTSSGFAAAGGDDPVIGFWPAGAQASAPGTATAGSNTPPPAPPKPPAKPPAPKAPPAPPAKPGKGSGIGVSIDNGVIRIDGIKDMVDAQLDAALSQLKTNPHIPADVREKLTRRIDKIRSTVSKRLGNLNIKDLDQLGAEMDKMGDELEDAMKDLDKDLSRLGDQLGKDLSKQLGNIHINIGNDDDDDDDIASLPMTPGADIDDDDDLRDAISDLKDLALKPGQRDQITKLRADSDKSVAAAKKQLDELSTKLEGALANPATTDADIARYVDQISAQEAAIRKARILAWVQARRVLDDAQRKKIEDAAKKKSK